jgi:hypothetical protein
MTFRKLDLFPSSGKRVEKTPTQLGPLERANLNYWTVIIKLCTSAVMLLVSSAQGYLQATHLLKASTALCTWSNSIH